MDMLEKAGLWIVLILATAVLTVLGVGLWVFIELVL